MANLRTWLKDLREKSKLTQQNVAEKLNITKQYYQQIEAHERQKRMDITLMTKLSEVFNVSFAEIVNHERALNMKIEQNESHIS